MKKLSFMLLSLVAVTLFTSCNKDDNPVNKQSYTSAINCRAINGTDVAFSQATAQIDLNYTDMTIKFTTNYKDIDGMSHTLTAPEMKLNPSPGSTIYRFEGSLNEMGPGNGYIDLATGMIWFTFKPQSDATVYYLSTHLLYAYTTTTITNPGNGFSYNHEQSAYLFVPNARGDSCTMSISNFTPNTSGSIEVSEIQYERLEMTPTEGGYTITAAQVAPKNYKGSHYTLNDLNITLDNQGRAINGSFKCNDLEFRLAGYLFPSSTL